MSADQAATLVLERALSRSQPFKPQLIVTLNPEILVQAKQNPELAQALSAASLSVADGVGITWPPGGQGRHCRAECPASTWHYRLCSVVAAV